MNRLPISLILAALLVAPAVQGQVDPAPPPDLAEPPPLPPKIRDEDVTPTVTIRAQEEGLVEEYSLNGRVYMVKITPEKGPPYYYLDTNGDGQLELQPGDEAMNPVRPVYWKVKEWE